MAKLTSNEPHNQKEAQASRFPLWMSLLIPFLLLSGYTVLFFVVGPENAAGLGALITVPVLVITWMWGTTIGVSFAIFAIPYNTLCMNAAGLSGWDVVFREGGGPGMISLVFIAWGIGYLLELQERLSRELKERKKAEEASQAYAERLAKSNKALMSLQGKLVELGHQAGVSEMATNTLHNVGNVLNSMNISVGVMSKKLARSKVSSLGKVATLFSEQEDDYASFFSNDPRAPKTMELFFRINEALERERELFSSELELLSSHVLFIRDIISVQQNYTVTSSVLVEVELSELLSDCVSIVAQALEKHSVEVKQHVSQEFRIRTQKARLMQVLVNLLKNAIESLDEMELEAPPGWNKQLELSTRMGKEGFIAVEVRDTGIGISSELLTKIFHHGFTTKAQGHGFGLHYCANTIRDLGGEFSVESPGLHQGATFVCLLPFANP